MLADYVIDRHYPEVRGAGAGLGLLEGGSMRGAPDL